MRNIFNLRRLKKRYKFLAFGLVIIIVFQFTSGCFTFKMSQKEADKYFKDKSLKPKLKTYQVEDRTVSYADIGSDSLPTVFFFHGAPGSWSAFVDFMADTSLTNKTRVISVDRPGYGYSNFGNSVTSLERESLLLRPLLELKNEDQPTILVGHSLGGPVIARLAMDHPDLVDYIIMVAPSIDPDLEPDEDWFRYPLKTPFLSWILPTSFRVTNDEIYVLEEELREMMPLWEGITIPCTVIQGGKDSLVDPGNADFAKRMLVNSSDVNLIVIEDMNHFVPWSNPELIKEAIFNYLNDGNTVKTSSSHGN